MNDATHGQLQIHTKLHHNKKNIPGMDIACANIYKINGLPFTCWAGLFAALYSAFLAAFSASFWSFFRAFFDNGCPSGLIQLKLST